MTGRIVDRVADASLAGLPQAPSSALFNTVQYWLRPDKFTERMSALGDRFTVKMLGTGTWLCLTHPNDIKAVFTSGVGQTHFAEPLRRFSPHELIFGRHSLTSLDGAEHLASRKMLMPAFSGAALARYEPTIAAKAQELVQRWPLGEPVRAIRQMQWVTLEIIMAAIFGVTEPTRLDRLREAVLALGRGISSLPFLIQMMISTTRGDQFRRPFPKIEALKATVDAIVCEEMAARTRTGDTDDRDVLGRFMNLKDEQGQGLSEAEICDQMRLMLIGGHDTTALTIAWVIERMTHHPQVLAEVERTVRAGDDSYLDAVIHETLRMRALTQFTIRLTKQPLVLDGLTIPAETLVVPYFSLVHRRSDIYPEPLEFRPERFHQIKPGTFSWIPFGGGMRRCIGAAMAMLEARIILAALVRELDLRPVHQRAEAIKRSSILIAPDKGALVIAQRFT